MKKVAVLGGGNTGCCFAAALALRGYKVNLYESKEYWHEHIDGFLTQKIIEVVGNDMTGFAHLSMITDNLSEAIAEVEMIFVCMVSWRHQWLADSLKPLVRAGQTIIFSAGNFGSIILKRSFGIDSPIIVGEMLGNIFPCRMIGDGKALIAFPYAPKKIAAFPAKDNAQLVEAMSQYLKCDSAKNVFETALNIPNLVIHLAGSLLNTCAIDRNPDFRLYKDGLSEHVIKCQIAVEKEKEQVMEKMGYLTINHTDLMKRLVQYDQYPELNLFRSLAGPNSMNHRYIIEDSSVGVSLLADISKRLGIETPIINALLLLSSTMLEMNFISTGLKLSDLGMGAMNTVEEINEYLFSGC